jgi:hypothetical protein
MAGFCEAAIGLWAPKLAALGAKSPIVSGRDMKYSRFRETVAGDRVRSGLRGRSCTIWNLSDSFLHNDLNRRWTCMPPELGSSIFFWLFAIPGMTRGFIRGLLPVIRLLRRPSLAAKPADAYP